MQNDRIADKMHDDNAKMYVLEEIKNNVKTRQIKWKQVRVISNDRKE